VNRLLLDRNVLAVVISDSGTQRAQGAGGRVSGRAVVTSEAIEDAKRANTTCTCEAFGLRPGMPADELIELGSGCTGLDAGGMGWVCEALDKLRRRYGR
jgi:hypothetical protein